MADKDGYNLPLDAANDMLGDAHNTNWAENYPVLPQPEQPDQLRARLEERLRPVQPPADQGHHAPAGPLRPGDGLQRHQEARRRTPKYANAEGPRARDGLRPPAGAGGGHDRNPRQPLRHPLLSQQLRPAQDDHPQEKDGKDVEEPYNPTVDATLAKIAQLIETFGATRVVIEGHTDSSMKSQVAAGDLPALAAEVKKLSEERAAAVRKELVDKYKVDPNRVTVRGLGWDKPADPPTRTTTPRIAASR